MLIPSPRHTATDLALWRDLEEADLRIVVPQRLITEAVNEIRTFASSGPCYVATSWGKDSVVMLDMLLRSGLDLPVVYVRKDRRDNPDCELVRDTFRAGGRLPNYNERTFDDAQSASGEHWRSVAAEFGGRRITGLRADESKARLLSIGSMGLSTEASCRPLGHWRIAQVFAHLAQQGLPVHPAYGCLGGGRWPREHIRTHSLGGSRGGGAGRVEWEREYYGEELRRVNYFQGAP